LKIVRVCAEREFFTIEDPVAVEIDLERLTQAILGDSRKWTVGVGANRKYQTRKD
jgi:hypothetical protein